MSSKGTKQTSFRLPKAFHAETRCRPLGSRKQSVAHLVRDALRDFLDRHEAAIRPIREERDKRGGWL